MWGWISDVEIYRCRATIDETPRYKAYIASANALRDKYRKLVLNGTYRDRDLAEVSDNRLDYTTFENKSQIAVFVANLWLDKPVSAKVSVDGAVFAKAETLGKADTSGEGGDAEVSLGKNGLAFLIFNKIKKITENIMKKLAFTIFCAIAALATSGASLADFPRYAGENSDSQRIVRAIESVPLGVLDIPEGRYELDSTVSVTNGASLRMESTAKFGAIKPMTYMLFYDATFASRNRCNNAFISGGEFDANGLADTCVKIVSFQHFTFRDTVFRNPKKSGLTVGDAEKRGGYELVANNLYFRNTMRGLAGNVGMLIYSGDCHFTDCIIVDYTIGIDQRKGGANRYTRCHVWGGPVPPIKKGGLPEMLIDSICFKLTGGDTLLRDCYADTGLIGFLVEANTRLLGVLLLQQLQNLQDGQPCIHCPQTRNASCSRRIFYENVAERASVQRGVCKERRRKAHLARQLYKPIQTRRLALARRRKIGV